MDLEYNTARPALTISEYGRNVKKMIDYAISIEDREKRNQLAQGIVKAMARLNPQNKDAADYWQKIWDHLFILSDFKLDVDTPYTKPTENTTKLAPAIFSYPPKNTQYRYYGKNIQRIIQKTTLLDEGSQKNGIVKQIANHLKKSYLNWNRDSVTDEIIFNHLADMSDNKLKLDEADRLEKTSDILAMNKKAKFSDRNDKFLKNRKGIFRK